jgi:hypothetical protein
MDVKVFANVCENKLLLDTALPSKKEEIKPYLPKYSRYCLIYFWIAKKSCKALRNINFWKVQYHDYVAEKYTKYSLGMKLKI